jgi:hypothetical protein
MNLHPACAHTNRKRCVGEYARIREQPARSKDFEWYRKVMPSIPSSADQLLSFH